MMDFNNAASLAGSRQTYAMPKGATSTGRGELGAWFERRKDSSAHRPARRPVTFPDLATVANAIRAKGTPSTSGA